MQTRPDLVALPELPTPARYPAFAAPGRRRRSWSDRGFAAAVAIVAGVVFVVIHTGLIDDAYITMDYARTLAEHFQWAMIPGQPDNTETTPLYVILVAAGTWLLRSPVVGVGVVFVVSFGVLTYALRRTARIAGLPAWAGLLGALLLLLNPLLLSSVGLGVVLIAVLLSLLLLAAVQGRPVRFGLVAGLLALTRLDLVLFVPFLLLVRSSLCRGWWKVALPAAAVSLPWFTWSWYVLGSAIPDTLVIKQLQNSSWGIWTFSNGIELYLGKYPVPAALSLLAPALALIALLTWLPVRAIMFRRDGVRKLEPPALLAVGAVTYYAIYTHLHVAPFHWYYAPSTIALTIFLAMAVGLTATAARRGLAHRVGAGVATSAAILLATAQFVVLGQTGLPWSQAPIMTNGYTPADYARMGLALGDRIGDATVGSPDEIGTLAYFCACSIEDSLADRAYLPGLLAQREAKASPIVRWLLRLNYRHLDRDLRPRPLDWQLRRVDGPGPDPTFTGSSDWATTNHLELIRPAH
jgi:hypothetical protein